MSTSKSKLFSYIFDKENRKILINKFEVTIEKMDENEKNEMKNKLENFK